MAVVGIVVVLMVVLVVVLVVVIAANDKGGSGANPMCRWYQGGIWGGESGGDTTLRNPSGIARRKQIAMPMRTNGSFVRMIHRLGRLSALGMSSLPRRRARYLKRNQGE